MFAYLAVQLITPINLYSQVGELAPATAASNDGWMPPGPASVQKGFLVSPCGAGEGIAQPAG